MDEDWQSDMQSEAVRIEVLNRPEAEAFEASEPWACISITGHDDDPADVAEDAEALVGLLRLGFEDMETSGADGFTRTQAFDVLDFVSEVWDEIQLLVVHCEAGVSSSPAVAAAVARLKGLDDEEFLGEPFEPNGLVLDTLLEAAEGRADFAEVED